MNMAPDKGSPPSFDKAANLRQKVRAAGLDPNYWYPVERERNVGRGEVREVVFWKQSIALFRDTNGVLHAIANRCAHRQLKLSLGQVDGCSLVCAYHGWGYNGDGEVVNIPHDLFGRSRPTFAVQSYPVKTRYGLIWIFPGDPDLAGERSLPDIPELKQSRPWPHVLIDFTWNAHHSMIIDNVSDFTHAHLHRKYQPFSDAKLIAHESDGDKVRLQYEARIGRGRISGKFVDHRQVNTNHMVLCYEYPYQWSDTDNEIKHWLFVLPIDERTTRSFFIFYFRKLKVPFLRVPLSGAALQLALNISKPVMLVPLLRQDGFAVEAEQEGYERHWDAAPIELNPVVRAFQNVTVRKWGDYVGNAK